jgi:alpha-tubulin suppressor-like RCC1 family protein
MDVLRARPLRAVVVLVCLSFGVGCDSGSDGTPPRPPASSPLSSVPVGPALVRAKLTTNGSPTPALHTCGLRFDGYLFCWGDDSFGELGTGLPNVDTDVPGLVPLSFVVDVAAGFESTCAVDYWGAAWCWGDGRFGELGDGNTEQSSLPVQVMDLPPVYAIASAWGVSCALARNRSVWCWGGNAPGETDAAFLGDGTTQQSLVPIAVSGLSDVVAIAGVFDHFCALRADGGVSCWGHNESGQLGDGTTTDRLVPVDVVGIDDAVGIATGWYHTCALRRGGAASCWGDNQYGELGNGTTIASSVPVDVNGLPPIADIAAGFDDTCAVLVDGTSRCWGWEGRLYRSDSGGQQLGAGGSIEYSLAKLTPSLTFTVFGENSLSLPLGDLVSITTGNFFGTTCAVTRAGHAFCWGDDSYGEVGNGTTDGLAPVEQPVGIGLF